MKYANEEMIELLSKSLSKSDIYSAQAIAKISMCIYKKRRELNLSQKEFSQMMGVTQGMVSKWESANYNFTIESIAQIAEKLNLIFAVELSNQNDYINVVENLNKLYKNAKPELIDITAA